MTSASEPISKISRFFLHLILSWPPADSCFGASQIHQEEEKKTSIFLWFYLQAKIVGTSYLFDTELIRRHKNVGILNTEETPHTTLWTLLFLGFDNDEIGNKNEECSFLK